MSSNEIVVIDGPSGVGKSTVAKRVAAILKFNFVDTGALYRTVALLGQRKGIDWDSAKELATNLEQHVFSFDAAGNLYLDGDAIGEAIRTPAISLGASAVAKHPEVREALLSVQREIGHRGKAVFEGRDTGTVVFPDARHKFFLTATVEERARRRYLQLKEMGQDVLLTDVEADQQQRDEQDSTRSAAPLKKASDAIEIVSDGMSIDDVITRIIERVNHTPK